MNGDCDHTGYVHELFASFQGEGPRIGELQVFLRFAGCDRRCAYCDSAESREQKPAKTRIALSGGKRWFRDNPWSPVELAQTVSSFGKLPVCLTGGEPLLQADFLMALVPLLPRGVPVVLETNGLLADEVSRVIDLVTVVSADVKLPSSTGQEIDWRKFSRFLSAAGPEKSYVKAVVTAATERAELLEAMQRIAEVSADIPLIIQPVWPSPGVEEPDYDLLEDLAREALARLSRVRVIPQVHKYMGWK